MGFKQSFKKVTEVVNLENVSVPEGGDSFTQSYDEVLKVINTSYDGNQLNAILPLIKNVVSLDEEQMERFYNEISKHSADVDGDAEAFKDLNQKLVGKTDKKEGILEYIKAGTTTLTFANTLLTIVKSILAFTTK